ncbi:MAG TPA: hypothetical protein VGR08_06990 [Thermomicrobiales bacterium]|nr:hypothetical protein [Thermomicrobiales bacterium]
MRGTVKRRWGTCIALLIGMALLGHDALMVGNVHALSVPQDNGVHSRHHHAARSDVHASAGHHAAAQDPGAGHETGLRECSSIRLRVLRVGGAPDLEATSAPVPIAQAVWPAEVPLDDWWREPTAPPEIVRAMFQVYLI